MTGIVPRHSGCDARSARRGHTSCPPIRIDEEEQLCSIVRAFHLEKSLSACDIHTVTAVESWGEVGERVRQARLASQLSQADIAVALGIDRTAVARIEGGQRHVTALELFQLSETLGVPIAHFVTRPPVAVVSRRRDLTDDADQITRMRFRVDAALEAHARDAEWLAERGFLAPSTVTLSGADGATLVNPLSEPRAAALALRGRLGFGTAPLGSLASICGQLGLHAVVLDGVEGGASLTVDPGLGIAIVGGEARPGRRRFTAAHELGHFILQDEYATDVGVAASRDEREQPIDAFAGEFLLPRDALIDRWASLAPLAPRHKLIDIAGRYRVSWSAVVRTALEAGLVSRAEKIELQARLPQRGEFFEVLGQAPDEDLALGETSPQWRQAALTAWRRGVITASRAVELLHGAITESELPDREAEELP